MNGKDNLPLISFIIPTLNSERTIERCLKSIELQDYPKERIEVVIADGGSVDNTADIIKRFKNSSAIRYTLVSNELKTGESGKAVAIDASSGEILAFIDSDNELEGPDWLRQMVLPFRDEEIFAAEVLYWVYNRGDSIIDRYCALTGINDPICLFLGNYDRYSYLTGKWTGLKVEHQADRGQYLEVILDKDNIPTMGANGYLVRKYIFTKANYKPYCFDIDVVFELVKKGYKKIARPKVAIHHYFCDNNRAYIRKQNRRIRDWFYFKNKKMRIFEYKIKSFGFVKFILYTLLILPLFLQSAKGFMKKRDIAWFFHPLACWITFLVYSSASVMGFIAPRMLKRDKWRQ